ncbi:PREDICTED: cell division cycle protein 20 homolog [Nicrophorus vespilloides]|uniref:Cell division cycle protein 20 homolog n=1 Tax=Nicrophorus vespilloides TaxID=110193 RepID=A0ABM1NHN0_NICVS|nr:PREDICTED: cell division cycle protein 20 homolog [Nicrophorus vespilloides]
MAQFRYVSEISSLVNVDGPLTKGPVPRWQRLKGLENTSSSSSLNVSKKSRTPSKKSAADKKKTPSKTPRGKSPGRINTPGKTPCGGGGDRFIPSRSATNFDLGHFKLCHPESLSDSPTKKEMERLMCENLHGMDINKQRILAYQKKAPTAPDGFQNPMRVLYTQSKTPASVKNVQRYIPQAPDRILDAPDIIDDYYLNLIDWSGNNVLAAALGSHLYLWDAGTGKIEQLMELEGNDYICSVSWIQEGDFLAVGTMSGTTELWDCAKSKRLRVMDGHSARVGSLAWNNYVLTSGCRSGQILHHDVRQREHIVATIPGHTQEVCGLKWSTDGRYLASGGNDNVLNIWQGVSGAHHTGTTPLHVFTAHQAAVKALAWCPWQQHVLASGGGTADRHIRFWNCNTGVCVNSVDTKSQVCALLWSTNYKEIVSGHGFANNQLIIWKYPGMTKVTELTGHTARVLHLAMSPDGSTVLSAGADETLRLWKCFVKTAAKEKEPTHVRSKPSVFKQCIR